MLHLILGPMFSGKTSLCITLCRKYKIINKSVFIINHISDKRYNTTSNGIYSHNKDYEKCFSTEYINDVIEMEKYLSSDIIIVDEAQFFTDLKCIIAECDKYPEKIYIVSSLSGDFMRNPIGNIAQLIPHAERIEKLSGFCYDCGDGTIGVFTKKIYSSPSIIEVGGQELYKCVCRKHFIETLQ